MNDLVFALHAFAMSSVQMTQIFIFDVLNIFDIYLEGHSEAKKSVVGYHPISR